MKKYGPVEPRVGSSNVSAQPSFIQILEQSFAWKGKKVSEEEKEQSGISHDF